MPTSPASQQTSVIDGPSPFALSILYDYDGSGNCIYIGWAASDQGNAIAPDPAKPVWAIKKLTYNGASNLTTVQWAGGNSAFNYVWNNRAAGLYQ